MTMAKKVNLEELRETLEALKKEATKMGLPMARIRDIEDLEKTINLMEKNRAKRI